MSSTSASACTGRHGSLGQSERWVGIGGGRDTVFANVVSCRRQYVFQV